MATDDTDRERRDLQLTGEELIETFPATDTLTEHVTVQDIPERPANTVPKREVLRDELARGYPHDPFIHQARGLDALADGENVCVATSTSSGKTDIYGLQIARNVLDAQAAVTESTAYVVYPMKALAQDQQKELSQLYDRLDVDVNVEVYDGDTERGLTRRRIREDADVIISNFMGVNTYLHHHDKWARFFRACDLIVIDESHTYTGVQGMHVAWILRRLKRVIEYYGGDPQYVLTSATIGNPKEHSEALIDETVTVVDEDGSPQGARDLVLWNPRPAQRQSPSETPTIEDEDTEAAADQPEAGDGIIERQPASVEAPRVFSHLTYHDVQTLMFCPSRKLTELSLTRARDHRTTSANRQVYVNKTGYGWEPYHAGQSKAKRHGVEQQLKAGVLDGVASTSALELGINIGDIDATLLMGYPGQRQSFWQRIGRAGRDARRALSVLVADYSTLDQYIINHPEYLLEQDVEDAVVDTQNDTVFAQHLLCAADELAIDDEDIRTLADRDRLERAIEMWRRAGNLSGFLDIGVSYAGPPRPQTDVSLYSTSEEQYIVRVADGVSERDGPNLEPMAKERVFRDYHEGAVRVHDGRQYEVVEVNHDSPQPYIVLQPVDVNYFTRSMGEVTILDAESEETRDVNGFTLHYGEGTVLVHYMAYSRVDIRSNDVIDPMIPTDLPPITMRTQMCWLEIPDAVERPLVYKYADYASPELTNEENTHAHIGYLGGLHAAEHAMIKTTPLELMVDTKDLGGLSTLLLDGHLSDMERIGGETGVGSVEAVRKVLEARLRDGELTAPSSGWFVYDGFEGGLGFSRTIYDDFEALAERTLEQLQSCECGRIEGCPACTMDPQCGNDNAPLHREAAADVLEQLLGYASPAELEEHLPEGEFGGERRPPLFYS